VSYPDFRDWRARSRAFESMAAYSDWTVNLTGAGQPERIESAVVSASFFQVLGVRPEVGRGFVVGEDLPGRDGVVVVGHDFFARRFASDRSLVGRAILLDGKPYTVVGIAPPGVQLPSLAERTDLFIPVSRGMGLENRGGHYLSVVGRLRTGVTLEAARAELAGIARNLEAQYPASNTGHAVDAFPLAREIAGRTRPALLVLLGAVFLVLMIASVNVANMLLSRATARGREIAVRAALGAGRGRLIRQLLTESLLLALMGGAFGVLLATAGVELLKALGPADIPRLGQARVDGTVLLYALGISLATGALFGMAPAWHASAARLNESLKQGDRRVAGREGGARRLLVASELAFSVMLLIGAGLMLRSFGRLRSVDPGFRTRGILTAELDFPEGKYPRGRDIAAFGARLLDRMRSYPGIEAAGALSNLPLRGDRRTNLSFVVEGRPRDVAQPLIAVYAATTPGALETLGLPLLRGRYFRDADTRESPKVAIVNRTLANKVFGGAEPLGKRLSLGDNPSPADWATVVGVVGDLRTDDLSTAPTSQLYMPYTQESSSGMAVALRTGGDPLALAGPLRRAVAEIDPEEPVYGIRTMETIVADSMDQPRFRAFLTAIFAFIALLLAAIGIYGMLSYSVAQRTHEIGIRIALGAGSSDVLRLIVAQGMSPAAIGVAAGVLGGAIVSRLVAALLFEVAPTDLPTFVAVPAILLLVALAACVIPAARATRVDPTVALREE
jgi:putative ABC transport system permease protein